MQVNDKAPYVSLLKSLNDEYVHYQLLMSSLKEEAEILKKSSLEQILKNNAKKEAIVISLNIFSDARKKAIKEIADQLNIQPPISLKTISQVAPYEFRQVLCDYEEKFADVMNGVKKINDDNINLITFSLLHARNTFNYINKLLSADAHYDHQGQIKAKNLQGRLISQAG